MSVNSTTQKEPLINSFSGVGTIVGGAVGIGATNRHYNKIAEKTVKMFNGELNHADRFVRKHDELLTSAVNSKKGFFGKVAQIVKNNASDAEWGDKVDDATQMVVDTFRGKAQNALKKSSLEGDELESAVKKLSDTKITKSIAKSLKDAAKDKRIKVILASVVIGTLLFNALGKMANKEPEQQKANKVKENKKLKNEA